MASIDPEDNSNLSATLRSPFQYQHHSLDGRHASLDSAQHINPDTLDSDPDAFYRPFSDQRTTLPDIFVEGEDADMSSKKKHTHLNGSTPKPEPSPSTVTRTYLRSVSSPASSSTTGPKSPVVPTRTGLIKERVKQLEHSSTSQHPPTSSSRPSTASKLSNSRGTSSSGSKDRTLRKGSHSSHSSPRKREQNGGPRRPLFGEVLDRGAGAGNGGYGIPVLTKQRSNLETSLPESSLRSSRSRSQSYLESNPSPPQILSEAPSPTSEKLEARAFSPNGPSAAGLAPSRIPVPRRARRASDIGPALTNPKISEEPTLSSRSFGQSPRGRPVTPNSPSTRRYSPKRNYETGQTLTVDIKEPPPKLSPPLRSSRPRQPVSAATTAASRGKVTDRLHKPAPTERSKSKGPPKELLNVDVASRRDQVNTKLSRTYLDSPSSTARQDLPSPGRKKSFNFGDGDTGAGASKEGLSPLIEQASPAISQQSVVETDLELTPVEDSPASANSSRAKQTLFRQVMALRDNDSPISPETQLPEDFLSELGDAETINIVLGETPKLPSENFADPVPHTIHERDEDEVKFADGRGSIYPDDSVSVIFYQQRQQAETKVPSHLKVAERAGQFTLDSEARSQINRVLDHYQQGKVTPQMAHDFQRQIESLTPDIMTHDDWQSPDATRYYLKSVLDFSNFGPPTPSTISPGDVRRESRALSIQENSRHVRALSVDEDLKDEPEFRGTAIIYSHHRTSMSTSNLDSRPAPPPKSWRDTSDSTALSIDQFSRRTSASQPASTDLTSPPNGLGLSIDIGRPESPLKSPVPPAPIHSPPPPPVSNASREALIQPSDHEDMTSPPIKKASWPGSYRPGLPTNPAPRVRRADTTDDQSKRESTVSRPSLDLNTGVSPSNRASMDHSTPGISKRASTSSTSLEEKRLKERWNILKELIDTEHSYYHDMTIGVDIFMATAPSVASLTAEDRRLIFGNIEKIRDLASKFLDALKKSVYSVYQIPQENRFHFKRGSAETASQNSNSAPTLGTPPDKEIHKVLDEQTTVGQIFLEFAQEMEPIYEEWMTHHDVSNRRIEAVKNDPQVKMWLEECYENAKDITNAWSLDSLLVKPTQRYMKYPLLLGGLKKCTPPDHPDHDAIVAADSAIIDSTMRINEAKRRKDVIGQALQKKHSKQKQSQSNRLNVKKMLNFRGGDNKKHAGRPSVSKTETPIEDNSYEAIVQKFGGHFFQLQIVMRDFEKYCDDASFFLDRLDRYILALENHYRVDPFCRWPENESRIHQYHEAVASIQRHALPEHIDAVERFVINPVRKLWRLHDNPQHLMAKRKKLMPTYNKYMSLKAKRDKGSEKLKDEAEQYLAINDVLKLELPQLYRLTKEVVQACLKNFIAIQEQWQTMWIHKLKPFIDEEDLDVFFEMDITEFFHLVREEFFREYDPVEIDLSSMALTSRTIIDDMDINFLVKMPDPNEAESPMSSTVRPSTVSSGKRTLTDPNASARASTEQAVRNTPNINFGSPKSNATNRLSEHNPLSSNLGQYFGQTDSLYSPYQFYSAQNSAGPATPNQPTVSGQQTPSGQTPSSKFWFQSDWSSNGEGVAPTKILSEHDMQRVDRGVAAIANQHASTVDMRQDQQGRYSGIFHSALPADLNDDDEVLGLNGPPPADDGEPRVLFVVASLFEFNIDSNRREAGYPYLKYVAGEVFDILGQRGELWLARNQDDAEGTLGWIWEKHFALLPTDPQ